MAGNVTDAPAAAAPAALAPSAAFPRTLSRIAREIQLDWKNVHYAAKPYLDAMKELTHMSDSYGYDSARSVVAYFLSNASSWRGDVARRVKKELNAMLKGA